jgi:hypothetical protein
MPRYYIYLISFKDTNDVYIGKTTKNINIRFKQHKHDYMSAVSGYVRNKLNNNWDNVYIDIIDSIDSNEDLKHLINHPSNISSVGKNQIYRITYANNNADLIKAKLHITEQFHIYNYYNEGKYKLLNKVPITYFDDKVYKFFYYT